MVVLVESYGRSSDFKILQAVSQTNLCNPESALYIYFAQQIYRQQSPRLVMQLEIGQNRAHQLQSPT
jgi:hypothetical protein